MLRISEIELTAEAATLRLEGRVVRGRLTEVESACDDLLSKGHRVTLDLTDLLFADRDGIALLQALVRRGVSLANCSPFLTEELRQANSHGR